MTEGKGSRRLHGERLVLKRPKSVHFMALSDDGWKLFEQIIEHPVQDFRSWISYCLFLYNFAASHYTPENTVLVTDLLPALNRWIKVGEHLLQRLRTEENVDASRDALVQFLDQDRIAALSRILPLELLGFTANAALSAATIVKNEIEHESRNLAIENDLWSAWVCLTAKALEREGVETTGASTDKSTHESPFIKGIDFLQSFFLKDCHRYNGYESVRINTQAALRAMGGMDERMLMHILGWGLQFPEWVGYPGNLNEGSQDRIALLEERVKEVQLRVAERNKKQGFDPYLKFPHLRPTSEP